MRWIDESPERYAAIREGDMVVMAGFGDGRRHFVTVHSHYVDPLGFVLGGQVEPVAVACGAPMPDWQADPTRCPMGGVVDCPRCLARMERDAGGAP